MPGWLHRLDTVRDLLTLGGRTLVQGALGYLLAAPDPSIIPLPGIRTEQQARQNAWYWLSGHCRSGDPRRSLAPRRPSGTSPTKS
jgi:hypothetical protein